MRERLGIIGLVVLVLLDVVLVSFVVVRHTPVDAPLLDPAQVRIDEPKQSGTSGSEPGQSRGSDAKWRLLSVSRDSSYLRATSGSCGQSDRPVVELSADGGRTFKRIGSPDVTEVLKIWVDDRKNFSVIGADRQCSVGLYVTRDGGATWLRLRGGHGFWHLPLDRALPGLVHAPRRWTEAPCDPLSLSTVDNAALRILCTNGQIIGTSDEGSSWVALGSLPGASAVWFTSLAEGYALADRPTCPAAVLGTVDRGFTWDRVACLGDGQPQAISGEDDIVALVDGVLHVSVDAGTTWEAR